MGDESRWEDRVLVALAALSSLDAVARDAATETATDAETDAATDAATDSAEAPVLEEVALAFADRFGADDREYEGLRGGASPVWHGRVRAAVDSLRKRRLVTRAPALELTKSGRSAVRAARNRVAIEPLPGAPSERTGLPRLMLSGVLAQPLRDNASSAIGALSKPSSGWMSCIGRTWTRSCLSSASISLACRRPSWMS